MTLIVEDGTQLPGANMHTGGVATVMDHRGADYPIPLSWTPAPSPLGRKEQKDAANLNPVTIVEVVNRKDPLLGGDIARHIENAMEKLKKRNGGANVQLGS